MLRCAVAILVFFLSVQFGETKSKRSHNIQNDQRTKDVDDLKMVDVVKSTRGTKSFQSMDSHGNIHVVEQDVGVPSVNFNGIPDLGNNFGTNVFPGIVGSYNLPSGHFQVFNINGNTLIKSLRGGNMYSVGDDDYYDDDDDKITGSIKHFSQLMNNFMGNIFRKYNKGLRKSSIPEYIFIHYYAGQVITPPVVTFSPADLSTCPKVEFCLKQTRPLCMDKTAYCVAPLRKAAPCGPGFNNGNLPCLSTTISVDGTMEEPMIIPCISTLAQIGRTKRYCVIMIVQNTQIRETMEQVHQTVQTQLSNAHQAIESGLNAGRLGLMKGMESLKRALSGLG